ncbi:hypothetical protein ABZ618_15375 [Streptomyces roseolus]|uniref:hypothetical protein n=1 Tax=Streptomyces roseolus TaxID=67358 RepID=UPI0033D2D130
MDRSPGDLGAVSGPARAAGPDEGPTPQEPALATRNHGLPLEALRHPTVRATDATGRAQPLAAPWNRGGFARDLVQRVEALCAPGP